MLEHNRSKSIKKSMTYSFLFLAISALLVFLIVSLRFTSHTILENSIYYSQQINDIINREIDSYIDYMENISVLVAENEDVPQYLFSTLYEGAAGIKIRENSNYSAVYSLDRSSLYIRITDQFATVKNTRSDIANIGIFYDQENYIFNTGEDRINPYISIEDIDWIRETKRQVDGAYLSASHVQNLVNDDYRWVITLSRVIRNPYTNERQGLFFVDLNYDVISDLCENNAASERGYVFILGKDGQMIYHPKQQLLYSGLIEENIDQVIESKERYFVTAEEESRLYTMSVSDKTGWTVVGVSYVDELMKERDKTQYIYYLTAGILLGAASVLAHLLAKRITLPIMRLKESMKEVEKGNFANANVDIRDKNEIGSLGQSFNIMTDEIQKLMEQNIAEQKAKRKSELKALQSQINPHFLYNTLDSIIWMAESDENGEVVKMTSSLARLMRQSFNNQELVPLEHEMEHVKSYLTIQKMRYQDKLSYEIELADEVRKYPIIKLVLQPIVENAIYHGIKYKEGMGMIFIRGTCEEGKLRITIRDNGAGMDTEQLLHIFDEHKVNYSSNGVGVYNVQQRLKLYYGEEYGLRYESVLGEGTCVTLSVPMESDTGC